MVVFACGSCGTALKKNKVEHHYQSQCRNCNMLSCIDCGKEFWGNDYQAHTQCISEAEKYCGKDFVPKPNANKNEKKQQDWLQKVQHAIDSVRTAPDIRSKLELLKNYPNIPRKQAKFENFLANSLFVHNAYIRTQMWDLLMANTETTDKPSPKDAGSVQTASGQTTKTTKETSTNGTSGDKSVDQSESAEVKKLNKRERKEERRREKHKQEKKDKPAEGETGEDGSEKPHKKSKKRKRDRVEDDNSHGETNGLTPVTNGTASNEEGEEEEEEEEPQKKKQKTKFDWEGTITQVLASKGKELAVKKVRKKVLAEYLAQGCRVKTEEKLWAKFDKKLNKNPNFKVHKEKVKLVTS